MKKMVLITSPLDLAPFTGSDGVLLVSADELTGHAPDAHWMLTEAARTVTARASLWWRIVPEHPQKRLGFIGHYAARDRESAQTLLHHACAELKAQGRTLAVGPLDGTTWRRYRFITDRGPEPPFFLEPDNPDDYPRQFTASGFAPLARYSSTLVPDLGQAAPLPEELKKKLHDADITFRSLDPADFVGELAIIFDLSTAGFRDNFLYTPIEKAAFLEMYGKIRPFTKPELVLFALHKQTPVGFIFALPDILRAQRGEPIDTVIIKTIAVLPEWNGKGIGAFLLAKVSENARFLGFSRAIHALIYEKNRSRNLSNHYGSEIRQYTLFSREIA